MFYSSALIVASTLAVANAANDWSKPCLSGQCEWNIPSSAGSSSGAVKIWTDGNAISDITTAAGWEIIDCSADKTNQNIRLVCTGDASDCQHLYSNGAVDKVVRLPDNCGSQPFARVAKAWVPADQSIPSKVSKRLQKRGSTKKPQVKALTLDTNFHKIDSSKLGSVNFALVGSNAPGAPSTAPGGKSKRELEARFGFGDIGNAIKGAADKVGDAVGDAVGAVTSVAGDAVGAVTSVAVAAASAVTGAAGDAADAAKSAAGDVAANAGTVAGVVGDAAGSLSSFDNAKDIDLPPIVFDKSINLVDQKVPCGPVDLGFSIDAHGSVNALAHLTVDAAGTLVPPNFDKFSVVTTVNGTLGGDVTLKADATGSLDTGKIELFEVGIPGFDFPGILSVGPSFVVNVQGVAQLTVGADVKVGLNYNLNNVKLVFPPSATPAADDNTADITPADTPIELSVVPAASIDGKLTAHLLPTLQIGVTALANQAKANIFLDLDANASAELAADVSDKINITPRASKARAVASAKKVAGHSFADVTTDGVEFGGCGTIGAGIAVNAGTDAKFFGIFDKGLTIPLFSKNFQLFQKCFGDKAKRSYIPSIPSTLQKRALGCPASTNTTQTAIAAETIAKDAIKAL